MGNTETAKEVNLDFRKYAIDTVWLRKRSKPPKRVLLLSYAHPDDESFGNAGTIARYSDSETEVHLICATRGECGEVSAELLAGHQDLGSLRTAELINAGEATGLTAIHFLGYRDSGMLGSVDNANADSFYQAPLEKVTAQVVVLIRALKPKVVITFGPYGGYGHPDHIKIHRATLAAFSEAGNQQRHPNLIEEGFKAWTPGKLYYATFGTTLLRINVLLLRLRGKDPRRVGENNDIDMVKIGEETTPATTVINCANYLVQKDYAWRSHRSQFGTMQQFRLMPGFMRRYVLGREQFTRAIPPWIMGQPSETDLFTGL